MLGEFFAARADEVDDLLVEEGPHGRFPTIEANALSHVPIARLGEILGAGAYDDVILGFEGRGSESGEAVLFSVPSAVRDALAHAGDLGAVAERWAATEELRLSNWRSEDALELLRELSLLAREARTDDRGLWYWWSL
jgi:hypothetical protein